MDGKVVNALSSPVNRDLVVVGAGIVGASGAYHAARAGAVVTLVDAGRPGAGVTADSFAWSERPEYVPVRPPGCGRPRRRSTADSRPSCRDSP